MGSPYALGKPTRIGPPPSGDVTSLIRQSALRHGIDPDAALAVAPGEGGLFNRRDDIGDLGGGGSYGPFQLYAQGELPAQYRGNPTAADAWAWSAEGIDYAIRRMAERGARGLKGGAAVEAIVRKFERPANPDKSVAGALSRLGTYAPMPPLTPAVVLGSPPAAPFRHSGSSLLAGVFASNAQALGAPAPLGVLTALTRSALPPPAAPTTNAPPAGSLTPQGGAFALPLSTPMPQGSEFGIVDPEGAPSRNGKRYHAGKDWFAPAGSTVASPWAGKVVEVKQSRGNSGQVFGGVVKIQAADGRVFVARHIDPAGLKVGQTVGARTPIGSVSPWTGGSPHAHIEVWKSLRRGYSYENMLDPVAVFGG